MERKMVTIDDNMPAAYAAQATDEATVIYPIKRLRTVTKHVKWERSVKLNFGNIKRGYFYLSAVLSILIFAPLVFADGGMIIWPPPVHLDQTAQNAIVAWNGKEEIIILSNNIKSDSNATVLRIVPLPSNPSEIKESDPNCFEKLIELMNDKLHPIMPPPPGGPGGPGGGGGPGGIEIIFHEKIGVHDVTVVKVNNMDYFLNWIKNFAQDKELPVKEISQTFRDGVANHLKRQIEYFVFDVIEPNAGQESIKPLIYRFDCDCLYYPLLISGISEISESLAKINLFLITPKEAVIFDPPYSYYTSYWFYSYGFPVEFTEEELTEVSEDLANLFEGPVKARNASLYSRLNLLTRDLTLYPSHYWNKQLTLGSSSEQVKALQKTLINEGVWESDQKATGYFGLVTKDALAKFQEKYLGFSTGTGYFGQETRQYFKKLSIKLRGQIIYVDADANGANDGSSWANAYNHLQDALAAASILDEIRVAEGIYTPAPPPTLPVPPTGGIPPPPPPPGSPPADLRLETFQLKNGVTIKGGYAGFGEADPNARDIELYETILSGDLAGNDRDVNDPTNLHDDPCRAENSYHVVTGSDTDETAVLDGFTITSGYTNGGGGGMYIQEGSPTIYNCTFRDNCARDDGGAIAYINSSSVLKNCTFINNSSRNGGGIYCNETSLTLTNCIFSGNTTHGGSGTPPPPPPTIPSGSSIFTDYVLSNNIVSEDLRGSGGGIYCSSSSTTLTNCTFTGNLTREGGGICTFQSALTLNNCTFSGNLAKYVGGIKRYYSSLTLTNCILWNDTPEEIDNDGKTTVVTYSNIQGGWPSEGNIDADPLFVEPGYWDSNGTLNDANDDVWVDGDYQLLAGSPCIDAGDPNYAAEPNEKDLDGQPRVMGGRIDMGAYEYRPPIPAEVRIIPRTINLSSKGNWMTCYIWLPEEYNVADIDPNSVLLENEIVPEKSFFDEERQVAIVRFSREEVQAILTVGEVELTITGQLKDGITFEGMDVIIVIDEGRRKN